MYKNEFLEALNRTERFNLLAPSMDFVDGCVLSDPMINALQMNIQNRFGILDPDRVAAKCFSFHSLARPIIEEVLKCPTSLTIGWLEDQSNTWYKMSEFDLRMLLEEGPHKPNLDLHAWITLPTMEIIDLTFSTTYGRVNNLPEYIGGCIMRHPDELVKGLKYHPMLLGEDFFCKLGVMLIL